VVKWWCIQELATIKNSRHFLSVLFIDVDKKSLAGKEFFFFKHLTGFVAGCKRRLRAREKKGGGGL
jgi:hypothetical protein